MLSAKTLATELAYLYMEALLMFVFNPLSLLWFITKCLRWKVFERGRRQTLPNYPVILLLSLAVTSYFGHFPACSVLCCV